MKSGDSGCTLHSRCEMATRPANGAIEVDHHPHDVGSAPFHPLFRDEVSPCAWSGQAASAGTQKK